MAKTPGTEGKKRSSSMDNKLNRGTQLKGNFSSLCIVRTFWPTGCLGDIFLRLLTVERIIRLEFFLGQVLFLRFTLENDLCFVWPLRALNVLPLL